LSRRRLELLQPHCYIVNTARGEIIDESALGALIAEGRIAGAGLDVFENEPAVDPQLMASDNVLLLPHLSSATVEGRREMGEKVAINIQAFADGHTPPDRVLETMY
jgi:glyoxylate reductase